MILTGSEIIAACHDGRIRIDPFDDHQVNPNSYNVRLGARLLTYTGEVLDPHRPNPTRSLQIGPGGFVMEPGELYLGHTVEHFGSAEFVPLLFGRSSTGRLGIFVEITSPIGDIGYFGQWTFMITVVRPLRVYAGMLLGQVMFFASLGNVDSYNGKYQNALGPQASAYWRDVAPSASGGLHPLGATP